MASTSMFAMFRRRRAGGEKRSSFRPLKCMKRVKASWPIEFVDPEEFPETIKLVSMLVDEMVEEPR